MKALRVLDDHSPAKVVDMDPSQLTVGDVHLEVHYSSLNYKDALAVTGKGKILKKFPLNPGIDAAGVILKSNSPRLKVGQKVLVTGCGTGEDFDGGYAEQLNTLEASVISLPEGMNLHRTMFFGTAGFTAALAIHRMIQNNQTPEKGPILVTGATGGVGNFSIAILNHLGFEVWALTGKKSVRTDQLKKLGAHEVMTEEELNLGTKPLEKAKFGGAIDNIGGKLLPKILAHTQLWGNVSSIGLAAGHQFETTVMPFILRGVSLLGVSSNNCPLPLRREIWRKLSQEWNCPAFNQIAVEEITLEDILEKSKQMLARNTSGRTVVRIRS